MTSEDIDLAQALYRCAKDKDSQFFINCELFAVPKEKMLEILNIQEPSKRYARKNKRRFKTVPIEIKQKAIERYFQLKSYSAVAREFQLNDTTIRNWIKALGC